MKALLVDMDGVLADDSHRRWLVEQNGWEYYDAYHEQMKDDTPIQRNIDLVNRFADTHVIVIVTGRPERYRQQTIQQLKKWEVTYHKIKMRPDKSNMRTVHFKRHIAQYMFSIGLDVIGAMDDRQDICIMYNQLGIPTLEAMKDGK